jgi:hypothetical protein
MNLELLPSFLKPRVDERLVDRQRETAAKWATLIEGTLGKWEISTEILDDAEGEVPSIQVICRAADGARRLIAAGSPVPTRIVSTANGAISFEWQDQPLFESLTFDDESLPEWKQFHSGRLVARERMQ